MRIETTGEHRLIRSAVREYVTREAPLNRVGEWEATSHYPVEFFEGLRNMGYYGIPFPVSLGGDGLGAVELAIVGEELGRHGLDLGAGYSITVFAALNIVRFGRPDQIRERIAAMLAGRERYAIGITEPDAGSDAAAVRTRATHTGKGFVLSGHKVFATGAGIPGTTIHILARTGPSDGRKEGLSVFLVPNGLPGIKIQRLRTVGRHMLGTYEIYLDDVLVPESNRLGGPGKGWAVVTAGLEIERVFAAAQYAGAAMTALDIAVEYAKRRSQFGRPIGQFQAIGHRLADVKLAIESARLLAYRAASTYDDGESAMLEASMAKLASSEALQQAAEAGMQTLGGYGYTTEYPMERIWREARSATITAGTSEIQRSIIANSFRFRNGKASAVD